MRSFRSLTSLTLSMLLLNACEVGPDYKRPKIDMPDLDTKEEISQFVSEKWWDVFQDATLSHLEELALKRNADLRQAIANIDEARAAAGIASSDLLPTLGMKGDGGKNYASARGKSYVPGLSSKRSAIDYTSAATVCYELDFFGKYRRANEAARAVLLSTRAARETVLLTVTADVAKSYFLLRSLDAKLAIARRTLKTRQESHQVYKSRFLNGYCTELDYLRIESDMLSVNTTVINLECELAKAETSMSVLIGSSPREMISRATAKDKAIERLQIPSSVPTGIPSDILARRPDILRAEAQLIAANAKIGEARAAHFPSISLTGIFGFESNSLASLFDTGSNMWNFGGAVNLPIFSGGKISSQEGVAKANYRKMLIAYEKSIQTAFKETLDALVSNRKNREIVVSRTRQVDALKRSYHIALKQKESGLIGLLDLLDVERGLLSAEMDLVGALQNQLGATVDLCKALGGGWKMPTIRDRMAKRRHRMYRHS
ncbi:MAG: efflux transporter outer membrane subunit [Holosporaceae bacterium]|nr:efflux transporter outer membrane subunit [Holosporaceae bacterium]